MQKGRSRMTWLLLFVGYVSSLGILATMIE
jgi:hypothetical protein